MSNNQTNKIMLGHSYIPNWIGEAFTVNEIRGQRVMVEFDSGHKRNFFIALIEKSITHDPDCFMCECNPDD